MEDDDVLTLPRQGAPESIDRDGAEASGNHRRALRRTGQIQERAMTSKELEAELRRLRREEDMAVESGASELPVTAELLRQALLGARMYLFAVRDLDGRDVPAMGELTTQERAQLYGAWVKVAGVSLQQASVLGEVMTERGEIHA